MARNPRIFQYTLIFVLVAAIIVTAYFFILKITAPALDPLEAVPAESSVFIKLNGSSGLLADLKSSNEIWQDLMQTGRPGDFINALHAADSMIKALGYQQAVEENPIYLALAGDGQSALFSMIMRWPAGASEADLDRLLAGGTSLGISKEKLDIRSMNVYHLYDSAGTISYYALGHGLLVVSRDRSMVESSARRLDERSPLPETVLFNKVAATAGRNVDANIYINFQKIPALAKYAFTEEYGDERKLLPNFGSWSEVDMLVKDDEILLNGYTEASDSMGQFLGIFRNQEPRKIEVTRILPYNTSVLLNFGVSNFGDYYRDYANYLSTPEVYPEREAELGKLKRQLGPACEENMTSWIGTELALAVINPHLNDPYNNTFMAIQAADIESAVSKLAGMADANRTYSYRDYTIRRIGVRDLLPVLFGRVFAPIRDNYFTRVEDYIVFANSGKSLENLINIFLSGKTLEQNENFKQFTDNVADESNLFCYFSVRNSTNELENILAGPLSAFVKDNPGVISNFEAIAVQFKSLNKMFFTSVYLRYNKDYVKEDLSIWKAYLDAPVYGQPYFVKDHRTNTLKIVAFDTLNQMYLIDHVGNIEWKLNIGEKVISDVHTVDYYRNGKIQYLFNTRNRIYLIDLLGRDVEGYPVQLKEQATNGLAVFDYDNNRDYRILLACDDNRVYNFDIKGKKTDGWKNPMAKSRVSKPVQHLREQGKDYILMADEDGNVRVIDRRGRDRINLKNTFQQADHAEFYVNETNSKGIFLTTDISGKLVYIKDNGKIEFTDFGKFSPEHYFLYEDFDNKGGKDFIYLDGNKLSVFDRFKNVMFTHTFENEIHSMPVIIPVSAREKLIGIVSRESGKIYLFDRDGNLLSTPDHIGKTRMLIGSLNRDGQLNMIVGFGNTIYNYYFR